MFMIKINSFFVKVLLSFLTFLLTLFVSNSAFAAPPPPVCSPWNFNNAYEQINPGSVVWYVFDSWEVNNFDVIVGPGTTNEAATWDIEYVTLFFDWDLDGVFDYTTNDSCTYNQAAWGCTVNLQVDAPSILTWSQVYNGRAHLVYNTPTTDPCANLPWNWWDIEDFTVEVMTNPPTDIQIDSSSNTSKDENTPSGNLAWVLSTIDPDTWDTYIYTFVPWVWDDDNSLFTLSWSNVNFAFTPDFEIPIDTWWTPWDNIYTIRVETEDPTWNTVEQTLSITINDVDEVPPVITLTWADPIIIQTGDPYVDFWATANDDVDGNITLNIVTVNPVNSNTPGTYTITYNVSDAAWNNAIEVIRTVIVITWDIPVITLIWSDPLTHEVNTIFSDPWANASDTEDGDITSNIVVVNPVDDSVLWLYTITYNVVDSNWNDAVEVTRTVDVVDTTSPVIAINGLSVITQEVWWTYTDLWATCTDNYDITCSVISSWLVDDTTLGTYTVSYDVTWRMSDLCG